MTISTSEPRIIPPLTGGERLTREEFEQRYEAMPGIRAELVEGVVYMSSPVRLTEHGEPHFNLITWFGHYKVNTPGVRSGDNTTLRLDNKNELQPDVIVFIDPAVGGQARIEDGYLYGSAELVAEVSASTARVDQNAKFEVYRRNQVSEYLLWRVSDEAVDWFVLRDGMYVPHTPDPTDGLLKSEIFPGLWLDAAALIRGDLATVLAALSRGLASPEQTAFVARLAARRQTP